VLLASPNHVRPVFDGEEPFPYRRVLAVRPSQLQRPDNPKTAVRCNEERIENVPRLRHLMTIRLGAFRRLTHITPPDPTWWMTSPRAYTHHGGKGLAIQDQAAQCHLTVPDL